MIGVDANILLRLLLNDDVQQVAQVRARLDRAMEEREVVWISPIALAETVWTFTHSLKVPRNVLATTIRNLAQTRPFHLFDGPVVLAALEAFETGNTGFSDCLIRAMDQAAGCHETLTFDRKASRMPGFTHP